MRSFSLTILSSSGPSDIYSNMPSIILRRCSSSGSTGDTAGLGTLTSIWLSTNCKVIFTTCRASCVPPASVLLDIYTLAGDTSLVPLYCASQRDVAALKASCSLMASVSFFCQRSSLACFLSSASCSSSPINLFTTFLIPFSIYSPSLHVYTFMVIYSCCLLICLYITTHT